MFEVDKPIEKIKEDQFNRSVFAESIAKGLSTWKRAESSLTVAIYGEWGGGKTSVKNLVRQHLSSSEMKFRWIDFNPWYWSGSDELATFLFSEIDKELSDNLITDEKKTELKTSWRDWSKLSSLTGKGLNAVGAGMKLLDIPGNTIVSTGGKAFENLGGACQSAQDLSATGKIVEIPSLSSLRGDLYSLMQDLKEPVIVAVDDIDRLTAAEVRQLFQLIKANSDFPNLAFLLLCQREVVEACLSELLPRELDSRFPTGRFFLDKIVHVGLTLPPLPSDQVLLRLLERTKRVVGEFQDIDGFSEQLDQACFAILPFFTTMRHVIRFATGLSFQCGIFLRDGAEGIFPPDLVMLEGFRMFEPDVFNQLPKLRLDLAGEGARTRVNEILSSLREERREVSNKILSKLIPACSGEMSPFSISEDDRSRNRFYLESVFDNYFKFVRLHVKRFEERVNISG